MRAYAGPFLTAGVVMVLFSGVIPGGLLIAYRDWFAVLVWALIGVAAMLVWRAWRNGGVK